MAKQTVHDILNYFREEAANNRDLGDKFERLIAAYLTKEPYYAGLFGGNVWLWCEWPHRGNKPDTGIDIVAEEVATGDVWAVQCKFNEPDHYLDKPELDSFFSTSGKEPFKRRLIVSTTDKWSRNLVDLCKNQQIQVSTLRVQDLDDSLIDWSQFNLNRPQDVKLKAQKKLRKHQEEALAKAVAGLKKAQRGKLIMACGTGKTFTALKIAEDVVPVGGHVLFLVPSISLISQSLAEWSSQSEKPLNCFAVCSDSKVGRNDEEDISTHDLAFPAHTNPRLLARQISLRSAFKKKNINVIFSTYQSIAVISEAQKLGLPELDLVICDEAHRKCQLFYHDIGDYLSREEKLNIVTEFGSIKNIKWGKLTPNKKHDWINQRDEAFEKFIPLGLKEDKGNETVSAMFVIYSRGVATSRDAWAYNFSEGQLSGNMSRMIGFFNEQLTGYQKATARGIKVSDFLDYEYVVNGKPAIEWIMDRYQLSRDKDSGILNDPNDWAREHDDPKYILNLLKSIITVSLETMKIVKALPALKERK